MSDSLNIRQSRQRLANGASEPLSGDDPPPEAAWDLAGPPDSASPPRAEPASAGAQPPPFPPFPPFPGLGEEEAEGEKGKLPAFDLMRFVRGLWKRRWLAAGIALAISAGFTALAFGMIRHKWEATVTLIMRTHQDQFSIGAAQPFKPQQYNLKTLLDTLKLPSSLQEVMERTGIRVLPRTLAAAIDVALGKDSNVFHIQVTWNDPQTAALVANQVSDTFVERTRSIRRRDAEETVNSYGNQLATARDKQRGLTAELLEFQEANKISDFETEIKVLLADLSRLDAEHKTKLAEAEAMHAARERLEGLVAAKPEMIVTSTVYRSPLKQRLADYEWQLQEARSRYTNENPKVMKLEKRVSVLEQMIEESNDEAVPENTYSPNSQRADLELRVQQLIDEGKVREAQVEALESTTQSMRDKLTLLATKQKEYQLLRARLAAADALEASLVSRVEEARVVAQRNESSFDIIERAIPPAEPIASARKLVVIGGTVLGIGAGVFVALLLELFDPFVRSRRDAIDATRVELVSEFQRVPEGEPRMIDPRFPATGVALLFRRLINDLDSQLAEDTWRALGVTSIESAAGRSLVATNLAHSLAIKERRVILVDADLRSQTGPRPNTLLDLDAGVAGLYEILCSAAAPVLQDTPSPAVRLLAAGDGLPPHDQGLVRLGSRQFATLVDDLGHAGGHLVFDLPPLTAQETVVEAASTIRNTLLVLRSGHTRRSELRGMVDILEARGVNLRAVVLTDVPADLMSAKPVFESSAKKPRNRPRWRFSRAQSNQAGAPGHAA